ncbi:MAG TPA: ORF6N domain-containing protein [Candidatus Methanoperedens sp.]|nr:ORF6N domain-containing protein [Candidatus Methanoperedens sp.]
MVLPERIERAILIVRGHKVLLDADLAALYGVETRRLNEQVRRNIDRFPDDFRFQLTGREFDNLKSQIATSSAGWGGKRKLPMVFTEHGALMAASVLNSPKAVAMSILVVRAFVKLRNILATHRHLAAKLDELERKLSTHDEQFVVLFDAIRTLMEAPEPTRKRIGFGADRP